MNIGAILAAALCVVLFTSIADARPRHHHRTSLQKIQISPVSIASWLKGREGWSPIRGAVPRQAFCGCGAAVRIFGRPIRSLWLARNWLRFPSVAPAPGVVAVRLHHVFVLERQISGSTWLVYDANSGRHRTRIHPRSISGFKIVNPHARMAMQ